jgi:hypothetical protein
VSSGTLYLSATQKYGIRKHVFPTKNFENSKFRFIDVSVIIEFANECLWQLESRSIMLTIVSVTLVFVVYVLASQNNTDAASALGDSIISEKSSSSFFNLIDDNSNGHISMDELKQFVVHTGGQSLDEQWEIQSAVANVLLSLDDNLDKVVKKSDLASFLVRQGMRFPESLINYLIAIRSFTAFCARCC